MRVLISALTHARTAHTYTIIRIQRQRRYVRTLFMLQWKTQSVQLFISRLAFKILFFCFVFGLAFCIVSSIYSVFVSHLRCLAAALIFLLFN